MAKNISSGIEYKAIKWRTFGRMILNYNDLLNNCLNVKYSSNGSCPHLKKTKISEEMTSIINEMFEDKEIDYNVAKTMTDFEKNLFDKLMFYSQLGIKFNYNKNKLIENVSELKKRYTILQGEILSGNTNKNLYVKIIDIIKKLIEMKEIDITTGNEIIQELENELI